MTHQTHAHLPEVSLRMLRRAAEALQPGMNTLQGPAYPERRALIHTGAGPLVSLVLGDKSGWDVVLHGVALGLDAPQQWMPLHAVLIAHLWLTRDTLPSGLYGRVPMAQVPDVTISSTSPAIQMIAEVELDAYLAGR